MRRTINADQFWLDLGRLRRDFTENKSRTLGELRLKLTGDSEGEKKSLEEAESQALEAHVRRYFVDGFLRLLNWTLGTESEGDHTLVPEAPVTSPASGTVRFLDYFGFETRTLEPLLVVETKRPSAELKSVRLGARKFNRQKVVEEIVRRINEADFSGEWGQWLADLRDYAAGVSAVGGPRRMVITNGEWMIVWLRPACFRQGEIASPADFLLIADEQEMIDRAHEVFGVLEFTAVLGAHTQVDLGQLPNIVARPAVECAMKGAVVARLEHKMLLSVQPAIHLMPVLLLRSRAGAWIRIHGPEKEYGMPHDYAEIPAHVADVEAATDRLYGEVCRALGGHIPLRTLAAHYDGGSDFAAMPAVSEWGGRAQPERGAYLVAVGDLGHFLRATSAKPECPYHLWVNAKRDGVADGPNPQLTRATLPNSFFMDGEAHRCCHAHVASAKSAPVAQQFSDRSGWRSARTSGAFCELWRVETGLCCRACSFETVCTRAQSFRIPCLEAPSPQAPAVVPKHSLVTSGGGVTPNIC